MYAYDDQLKVFVHTILKSIPYLTECSHEVISALALSMKQDFLEPGSEYFSVGDSQECMSIIYEGQISLHSTMDNGTEIEIERLSRGAVIGAYMFLVSDENHVTATCKTQTQIFTIERTLFTHIIQRDPDLLARLIAIQDKMLLTPTNPNILDFIQSKYVLKTAKGDILTGDLALRGS